MPGRKSIRLKNYDYSQPGYYFITICAKDRAKLFGNIIKPVGADDPVCPDTSNQKPHITAFDNIIKPVGADDPVCPDTSNQQPHMVANEIGKIVYECWCKINDLYENVRTDAFCLMPNHIHGIIVISEGGKNRPPLHKIIQGYKSVSTRMAYKYNYKRIWQRNYYDRIIRNEKEYLQIQKYIINNPS